MLTHVNHTIPPVFDLHSEVLILGSFPSVKSRETCFFYGHPRNRFWSVLAAVRNEAVPVSIEEKRDFLLRNRIAVWDVIESCDIKGSSDSSVKNAVPNDLSLILKKSPVRQVFTNGVLSGRLYDRYCLPVTGMEAVKLPSTSPANAAASLDHLIQEWSCLNHILNKINK